MTETWWRIAHDAIALLFVSAFLNAVGLLTLGLLS